MCINLGKWGALLSPVHLVYQAAKGLGMDTQTASIISGDFITGASDKKKDDKEKAKEEAKNSEAWQRYYASRDAQLNSSSTLGSPFTTGRESKTSGGF